MTTALETDVAQEMERESGKQSRYLIFQRIDEDTWKKLGEVQTDGAYAARMEAVERFGLMDEVRDGSLEIVSLGARFWLPKKPKVNVSESLDVS